MYLFKDIIDINIYKMVKKVTISDREYRLLKRTNSSIQKSVNILETENSKNRFYYNCLWECYYDSLKRIDNLKDDLNKVHGKFYEEMYNSSYLRYEWDELNKRYMNLLCDHESVLCKYNELTENGVKQEDNELKQWSGRIL
jgi:hypothetical protein